MGPISTDGNPDLERVWADLKTMSASTFAEGGVSGDRRLPAARTHTDLTHRYEREAEEFARALLIDEGEALREGLVGAGRDD